MLSSGSSLLMSHCSLPVEAEEEGMEGWKGAGGQEERTEGKLLDMQNKWKNNKKNAFEFQK